MFTQFNFRNCFIIVHPEIDAVTFISKLPDLEQRSQTLTIDDTINLAEKNHTLKNRKRGN